MIADLERLRLPPQHCCLSVLANTPFIYASFIYAEQQQSGKHLSPPDNDQSVQNWDYKCKCQYKIWWKIVNETSSNQHCKHAVGVLSIDPKAKQEEEKIWKKSSAQNVRFKFYLQLM